MARWFQFQLKVEPVPMGPVFEDSWHQPLSEPVRPKISPRLAVALIASGLFQTLIAPPTDASAVVPTTTSTEVSFPRSIIYQAKAEPVIVEVAAAGEVSNVTSGSPVIYKTRFIYQADATPVPVPAGIISTSTISNFVFPPRTIIYQSQVMPPQVTAETITEDKWHQPWSQPVQLKKGLAAYEQQFSAWSGFTPAFTEDKWHQPWSQPVRTRKLTVADQQAVFPSVLQDGWRQAWSEPVHTKKLTTAQQQFLAWSGHTPAAEVITEDKWHQAWSQPVRKKSGLGTWEQRDLFWSGYTPVTTAVFNTTITSQVVFPRSIIYQSQAWCPQTIAAPTVVYFPYVQGDTGLTFQKTIIYQVTAEAESPETHINWHQAWSEPVRSKQGLPAREQQTLAWSGHTPSTEVIYEDKWHQAWSQPVRLRRLATAQQRAYFAPDATIPTPASTFVGTTTLSSPVFFKSRLIYQAEAWCPQTIVPETITEDKWHQSWSQPVRTRKQTTAPFLAWCPQTITPAAATPYFPYVQGDTGLTFQKTIIYQVTAEAESPETHIYWQQPWSEPVRSKQGLSAREQQTLAWSGFTPSTEVIYENKWHQAWSQPVRTKSGLGAWQQRDPFWSSFTPAFTENRWYQPWSDPVRVRRLAVAQQQFLAWSGHTPQPETINEDKWHQPWSEPKRFKKGLRTDEQQFLAYSFSKPIITFGYYGWLAEPVRLKKGLRADLQQAFTIAPVYPNLQKTIQWYAPFSEPVRQKKGLWARLQQFWTFGIEPIAAPPVTVILDATETNNDTASIFAVVYNPPVRCYVSIKEVPGNDDAYASIEETD